MFLIFTQISINPLFQDVCSCTTNLPSVSSTDVQSKTTEPSKTSSQTTTQPPSKKSKKRTSISKTTPKLQQKSSAKSISSKITISSKGSSRSSKVSLKIKKPKTSTKSTTSKISLSSKGSSKMSLKIRFKQAHKSTSAAEVSSSCVPGYPEGEPIPAVCSPCSSSKALVKTEGDMEVKAEENMEVKESKKGWVRVRSKGRLKSTDEMKMLRQRVVSRCKIPELKKTIEDLLNEMKDKE